MLFPPRLPRAVNPNRVAQSSPPVARPASPSTSSLSSVAAPRTTFKPTKAQYLQALKAVHQAKEERQLALNKVERLQDKCGFGEVQLRGAKAWCNILEIEPRGTAVAQTAAKNKGKSEVTLFESQLELRVKEGALAALETALQQAQARSEPVLSHDNILSQAEKELVVIEHKARIAELKAKRAETRARWAARIGQKLSDSMPYLERHAVVAEQCYTANHRITLAAKERVTAAKALLTKSTARAMNQTRKQAEYSRKHNDYVRRAVALRAQLSSSAGTRL